MSAEKIKQLEKAVYDAMTALQKEAVATNTPASFQMGWQTYDVYLPDHEDEDMNDYLRDEYNKKPGDWISSSERC